jgi:DNA-directed RNA polymerase specialized sigma24 family protein
MDEALLVQLAREGREEALDELFTRVWPLVWHWAYAIVGSGALADDVAQETIYRAFAALDRFDAVRSNRAGSFHPRPEPPLRLLWRPLGPHGAVST